MRLPADRTKSIFLLAATSALLLATACGSDGQTALGPTPTPTPELEPGRTSIRTGLFLRDTELGDANFSAVLPEGWAAADRPSYQTAGSKSYPGGAIAKVGEKSVTISYSIKPTGRISLYPFPDLRPETIEIEGVSVDLMVPVQFDIPNDYMKIYASFPWLPGDPERSFGLSIEAKGIKGQEMFDETRSLIESIRFAPPPEVPRPNPTPEATPGADWVRVYAHGRDNPEDRAFSVLAPPDWEFSYIGGYDSFVGAFSNSEITISFDYGSVSASPTGYEYHLIDPDYFPRHSYWVEIIDNKPFLMYRPTDDPLRERAYTGITVDRIPGLPDLVIPEGSVSSAIYNCGGSFWATSIDKETQELVLAILRTLQAEYQSGSCR